MIMPVMGEHEAFEKLREIDSSVSVITASGFAKEDDMDALEEKGVATFLHKPFRRTELAEKIAVSIG